MDDDATYDPALAARFRAAFAYKGMKQAQTAAALGVSTRTVHRLENGQAEIDLTMQRTVIDLTGVPAWFLEYGFAPPVETGEADLRDAVRRMDERVSAALAEVGGKMVQLEQSLQEHRERDHPPGSTGDAPQ